MRYCKQEKEKEYNSEGCTYMLQPYRSADRGEIMPGGWKLPV